MSFLTISHRAAPINFTVGDFISKARLWMTVSAERRALAELDQNQLDDIGISPAVARREAHRPFWSVRRRN